MMPIIEHCPHLHASPPSSPSATVQEAAINVPLVFIAPHICVHLFVWFSCSLGLPTEGIYCVSSPMALAVFFCFVSLNILSLRSVFWGTKAVVSLFSVVPEMLSLECQLSLHKLMCLNTWSLNGWHHLRRLWNL